MEHCGDRCVAHCGRAGRVNRQRPSAKPGVAARHWRLRRVCSQPRQEPRPTTSTPSSGAPSASTPGTRRATVSSSTSVQPSRRASRWLIVDFPTARAAQQHQPSRAEQGGGVHWHSSPQRGKPGQDCRGEVVGNGPRSARVAQHLGGKWTSTRRPVGSMAAVHPPAADSNTYPRCVPNTRYPRGWPIVIARLGASLTGATRYSTTTSRGVGAAPRPTAGTCCSSGTGRELHRTRSKRR